jgi:hypothetical protein
MIGGKEQLKTSHGRVSDHAMIEWNTIVAAVRTVNIPANLLRSMLLL